MDPLYYENMIQVLSRAGRQFVAHAKIYGSKVDLNNADQVIAALYLREHTRMVMMSAPRTVDARSERIWHIEQPKEGIFTTIYCQRELKTIAPYMLPVNSIFAHNGKITICRECFFELIKHMNLGDPDVEEPGEETPLTTNN